MAQVGVEDLKAKLEKIKKQLSVGSGSVLLHGPLLKRSETLRKWNRRWFTLDPSTGKMEYSNSSAAEEKKYQCRNIRSGALRGDEISR